MNLEEKRCKINSQSQVFYGVRKSRSLLPCCVIAEKSPRFSNSVKKRGFESCSNISFPLGNCMIIQNGAKSNILFLFCFAECFYNNIQPQNNPISTREEMQTKLRSMKSTEKGL